ncbi:RloB family protein [Candidatus Parabeggiatoa sp. HSG14]|uniref:RloB family protein n=1 Tax=Candidatus Parabeggiatoa sp. HSG14 TaxID=3055593 RepID=UPI0025A86A20|nr:RloB family protein [Thiotrichales bacterium HSG14]
MRDKSLPPSRKEKKRRKQREKAMKQLAVGRILIVCEGTKTEPNYFKWWQEQLENIGKKAVNKLQKIVGSIDVNNLGDEIEIKGEGSNTKSVVKEALRVKNLAKHGKIEYTQIWCVFDCDSFPKEHYNTAIEQARTNDMEVAYSNEAFELWYLLHFDYINTGISREKYEKMLTKCLGEKYEKNDPEMYEKLLKHPEADQQQAIENAKKLLNKHAKDYAAHNPSTTVFKLVESLNDFVWQFRCQVAPSYLLPYPHDCKDCEKSTQPPYPCLKTP